MKKKLNVTYDYDFCYNEAKKYKTLQEFRKGSPEAARAAKYRKWLSDYNWLENKVKPLGYWNEETCREEALKHKTVKSFHDNSGGAYTISSKNGWLKDYTWLEREHASKWHYTKEACEEEAKKYSTLYDFRTKSRQYYEQSKSKGWLNDYVWLDRVKKPLGYWNKQTCFETAKEFTTIIDFRNEYPHVYQMAKENGWLNDYVWLEKKSYVDLDKQNDNVYAYVFEEFKSVYVGRTNKLKRRHREHTRYQNNDTVHKFICENGIQNPTMIVLEENVTIREGLEKENYWKEWYKEKGYSILNKAGTGLTSGSVGGIGCNQSRWTRDACYEEAKKYDSRTKFARGKQTAYEQARTNGWLDDYTWFKKIKIKYTYEMCYDAAKMCESVKLFRKQYPREYYYSRKNEWLKDFIWLKDDEQKYTYEKLYNLAKNYTNVSDLMTEHYDEWQAAKRLQITKDFTWLNHDRNKFTYEDCFVAAKNYNSLKDFKQSQKAYYKAASWHGWVIDYVWMKDYPEVNLDYDGCVAEASRCDCITKFLRTNPNVYWHCVKNKWIDSIKETVWKKK